MAKQTINIGSSPNKGDGDPLRDAFDKINDNFTELYTLTGGTAAELKELSQDYVSEMIVNATHSGISVAYNDTANTLALTGFSGAYADLTGAPSIPSDVSDLTDNTSLLFSGDYNDLTNKPSTDLSALGQNLLPAADATYDLGNNTLRFDDVYARKLRADGFVFFDEELGGAGQVLSLLKASDNTVATLKADIVGYATETYVTNAVQALDDDLRVGVSTALDSLNELSAAINDDPNFASTVTAALALKADSSSLATRVITGIVRSDSDADLYVYADGTGSVILAGQSDLTIGHTSGQVDIYGDVEFNNGTTAFQSGNSVDFNCDVDFNDVVKFAKTTSTGADDNPTLTLIDVNSSGVQILTSNDNTTNNWELPDGSEGQIMHFVAGGAGGSGANHKIKINNWWKRDGDTGVWSSGSGYWDVFAIYGFAGRTDTGMATAIFVDGAWRTTSPWVD